MWKLRLFKKTLLIIIWDTDTYHTSKYPTRKPKKEEVVDNG